MLQEQSLKTCHGSCLKSKALSFTGIRSLGSKYTKREGQSCNSGIENLRPAVLPAPLQSSGLTRVSFSRDSGIAEVFHTASMKNNTSRFQGWLMMGS